MNMLSSNCNPVMNLRTSVKALLAVALVLFSVSYCYADPQKGLTIAKERKSRDTGWGDSTASLTMILKNSIGDESVRKMRIMSLEVANDGDKGLTIFDEPGDVRGSAFLTYSHVKDADDQWLYLPALKRVKRISSRNKSGPFMGSEFAYEDLSSFEVDKYKFDYLKDEQVAGTECFLIEQTPTDKMSGYSKELVWLDKSEFRPLKVEYYDRKGELLKTLVLSHYEQYQHKYWRAHTFEMVNHQTGKSTTLLTDRISFNTGLKERDFEKSILPRLR